MSVPCSAENASASPPTDPPCDQLISCYATTFAKYTVTTFNITSVVFLLPMYLFILHLGFKKWRQQSFSMVAMSHFDVFAFNMVLVELLSISACTCVCCGIHTNWDDILVLGDWIFFISLSGQSFFHTLTCTERYLAVVHPVVYLRLKEEKWITARNVVIGLYWLLSALIIVSGSRGASYENYKVLYACFFSILVLELCLVLLFSLCILRVLVWSGPGEGTGRRHHLDQSKLRAFYVVASVLVVLVIKLTWSVAAGSMFFQQIELQDGNCVFFLFEYWMGLPSSLVTPLQYLKKKRRLFCQKQKNQKKTNG